MNYNIILALILCFILSFIDKINLYFNISILTILILLNIFIKLNDGIMFLLICFGILMYFLYI